jgi:hypothetical protein
MNPVGSGNGEQKAADVRKVLDRIAAALAALDERKASQAPPRAEQKASTDSPEARVKLRHNWG